MAVCRGVGWQELVRPAVVPGGQNRRVGQQPRQIAVRIQPTFFRRFNHAVDHGAALCAPRRVGEEKILPANHKGFYGTFGKVVAQLQPSVLQYTDQIRPLFLQIVYGFAQRRFWRSVGCFCPCQQSVHHRLRPSQTLGIPFFRRQIRQFLFNGEENIAVRPLSSGAPRRA